MHDEVAQAEQCSCLSRLSQPGVQGLLLGRTVASQVVHLSASVSSTVGVGITAWAAPSSLEWQTWLFPGPLVHLGQHYLLLHLALGYLFPLFQGVMCAEL